MCIRDRNVTGQQMPCGKPGGNLRQGILELAEGGGGLALRRLGRVGGRSVWGDAEKIKPGLKPRICRQQRDRHGLCRYAVPIGLLLRPTLQSRDVAAPVLPGMADACSYTSLDAY